MSAQTSYDINVQKAYAGGIFALNPRDVISRDVEGVAGIDFGVVVSRGTNPDRQCVLGGATDVLGVTIRELAREGDGAAETIKYEETQTAGIMRDGYIWAVCPTGCVPGDPVNYNTTTGILDSGAPVAGENSLDDCYWDSTAAAGELAVLRVKDVENITAGV